MLTTDISQRGGQLTEALLRITHLATSLMLFPCLFSVCIVPSSSVKDKTQEVQKDYCKLLKLYKTMLKR